MSLSLGRKIGISIRRPINVLSFIIPFRNNRGHSPVSNLEEEDDDDTTIISPTFTNDVLSDNIDQDLQLLPLPMGNQCAVYSNFYLKLPNGKWRVRYRTRDRKIIGTYEVDGSMI